MKKRRKELKHRLPMELVLVSKRNRTHKDKKKEELRKKCREKVEVE